MYAIKHLTHAEYAFPTSIEGFIPPMSELPDTTRGEYATWNKLFNQMFFSGVSGLQLIPRPGVDAERAWRHIQYVMRSWEPRHEHKEAGCAWLMHQWFESWSLQEPAQESVQ